MTQHLKLSILLQLSSEYSNLVESGRYNLPQNLTISNSRNILKRKLHKNVRSIVKDYNKIYKEIAA